jgi:hypothetical protein
VQNPIPVIIAVHEPAFWDFNQFNGLRSREDALKAFQGWCTLTERKIRAAILPNRRPRQASSPARVFYFHLAFALGTADKASSTQERAQRLQEGREKPLK